MPIWVIIEKYAKDFGMWAWEFEAQCSQYWWEELLKYPKAASKRQGKIPDSAFIIKQCIDRKRPPWQFNEECSELWWERAIVLHNETIKNQNRNATRAKQVARMQKAMRRR